MKVPGSLRKWGAALTAAAITGGTAMAGSAAAEARLPSRIETATFALG